MTGSIASTNVQRRSGKFPPLSTPSLTLQGKRILDHNGNDILLRGHGWGRWGAQREQDAIDAKAQGANVIRIPVRWRGYYQGFPGTDSYQADAPGRVNPANLAILDAMIGWVTSRQMWAAPFSDSNCLQNSMQSLQNFNYCIAFPPTGGDWTVAGRNLWTDPVWREEWMQLLEFFADRYKDTPYIAWWEIMPEPNPLGVSAADVSAFYIEAARRMMARGWKRPFLVGPFGGYNINQIATALVKTSIPFIYTGNLFQFVNDTHAKNLSKTRTRFQSMLDLRAEADVPVFTQQVGCRTGDDPPPYDYTKQLLNLHVANKVGFTWWEYLDTVISPDEYGLLYSDGAGGYITKTDYLAMVVASFTA